MFVLYASGYNVAAYKGGSTPHIVKFQNMIETFKTNDEVKIFIDNERLKLIKYNKWGSRIFL